MVESLSLTLFLSPHTHTLVLHIIYVHFYFWPIKVVSCLAVHGFCFAPTICYKFPKLKCLETSIFRFFKFPRSCDFNFNFFVVFSSFSWPYRSTLPVVLTFLKYFVAQTSRTRFFLNCWKVKYLILYFCF